MRARFCRTKAEPGLVPCGTGMFWAVLLFWNVWSVSADYFVTPENTRAYPSATVVVCPSNPKGCLSLVFGAGAVCNLAVMADVLWLILINIVS
jgi:hypothetical protein